METIREHICRPTGPRRDQEQIIGQLNPLHIAPDASGHRIADAIIACQSQMGHSQAKPAHQAVQCQKSQARRNIPQNIFCKVFPAPILRQRQLSQEMQQHNAQSRGNKSLVNSCAEGQQNDAQNISPPFAITAQYAAAQHAQQQADQVIGRSKQEAKIACDRRENRHQASRQDPFPFFREPQQRDQHTGAQCKHSQAHDATVKRQAEIWAPREPTHKTAQYSQEPTP